MRALSLSMVVLGLVCSQAIGFCAEQQQDQKKIYVSPENILVQDKNIFVLLDQQWVVVEGLHSDKDGIYLNVANIWICPRCGYENKKNKYGNKVQCARCGLSYLHEK